MTDKTMTWPDDTIMKQTDMREVLTEELHRLLSCYQVASRDDKTVVWAVLNKYLPII